MRTAYMNLDVGKTGDITPEDLRFYLTHWGIIADDKALTELFNYFDADGDGKVSYMDF